MHVVECDRYTKEYLEADKRSIANSLQIFYKDGSSSEIIEVEYPIGHRRRREEGIPVLISKFERNLKTQFSSDRSKLISKICSNQENLEKSSVPDFMSLFVAE
jgi:2-methylcitrate dehydratase